MAAPTATQQLYDLNAITSKMEQQIENLIKAQDEQQREILKLRESHREMTPQIARLMQQFEEAAKRIDRWSVRGWSFVTIVIVALLSLVTSLIVTINGLRKSP